MSYVEREILISWSPGAFFRRDSPRCPCLGSGSRFIIAARFQIYFETDRFPSLDALRGRANSLAIICELCNELYSRNGASRSSLRGRNEENYSNGRSFRAERKRVWSFCGHVSSLIYGIYVIEISSDVSPKRKYLCKKDR